MHSKETLAKFIYELNKVSPLVGGALIRMFYKVETGFSYNHSISTEFIKELKGILEDESIGDVICICILSMKYTTSDNVFTKIVFTDKAVYIRSNKFESDILIESKIKIEYSDISTLSLLKDDDIIVTTHQGDDHIIPTHEFNRSSIYNFLQFAAEKYEFIGGPFGYNILLTDEAAYIKSARIEYDDISMLSLSEDSVIVTTHQGNQHTIYTGIGFEWNKHSICDFFSFVYDYDSDESED